MPDDFDYKAFIEDNSPDPTKVRRGRAARDERRSTAKRRITIRIDEDIIDAFRGLTPTGNSYQTLINRALREWLSARDVKELIREDLREMLRTALEEGKILAAGTH